MEVKFLDEDEKSKYICVICEDLYSNAVMLADTSQDDPPCGHSFCKKCINEWYSSPDTTNKCPICRKEKSKTLVVGNPELDRRIGKLRVVCKYDCKWTGEYGLNGENYKTHISNCEHRGRKCEHCTKIVEFGTTPDAHRETCLGITIKCTNVGYGCTKTFLRAHLKTHLEGECYYRLASCPYHFLDIDVCKTVKFRGQVAEHLESCSKLHVEAFSIQSEQKTFENERLKKELFDKNKSFGILKKKFEKQKRRFEWDSEYDMIDLDIIIGETKIISLGKSNLSIHAYEYCNELQIIISGPMNAHFIPIVWIIDKIYHPVDLVKCDLGTRLYNAGFVSGTAVTLHIQFRNPKPFKSSVQ